MVKLTKLAVNGTCMMLTLYNSLCQGANKRVVAIHQGECLCRCPFLAIRPVVSQGNGMVAGNALLVKLTGRRGSPLTPRENNY